MASAPSLHLLWRRHCLRPGAKGGIPGSCLPKWNLCPPKRGLCPKESNRLDATGVQFEAWDPQNTDHPPRIREQEPFFRRFCGEDLFFVFLVFTHEFQGTKFLCPPKKNYLCLPSHATLAPDIQVSKFVCSPSRNDWRWRCQRRIQVIQTPAQTGFI